MRDAVRVQITVLGELALDGRPVRGSRLVALVLALVDARGRTVRASTLVEAVWDGDEPGDPAGALQALMARARRHGLRIEGTSQGYSLPRDGITVDAESVAEHLRAARDAHRRGDLPAARASATQARELLPVHGVHAGLPAAHVRLLADVVGLDVEITLDAGEAPGPLEELRALALRTPPDEPLVALLVRALAAQGRDAEALDVVEHVRRELAERYGTDPSSAVAQAHVALLRGELAPRARSAHTPGAPPGTGSPAAGGPSSSTGSPQTAPHRPAVWRRPVTGLVGREDDVVAVQHALAEHPVVTVVGVGGAGKTRLALEVSRRAGELGVAVHAIELAGLRDAAEVLPAVLAVAGVAESVVDADRPGGRRALSLDERIARAASELDGVLVLDNCEHVLGAVADVATALLAGAGPQLRILATSRAPLGIAGEAVHPLPMLPDDDAVRLLETRARAVRPGLAWDVETATALCHRLDNLPLAIELAAARLRSMPLDAVLQGVSDRFALLDNALRGLPDRHAGLWAMVDWSWALLDPAEQRLLTRLAVVPAPFTASAATQIAGETGPGAYATRGPLAADPQPGAVARGLAVLVEQSLLTLEEHDGRPARYRMLETVREYGELRLALDGSTALDARDRLVAWAVDEARSLAGWSTRTTRLLTITGAEDEVETLVAALRWALARGHEARAFALGAMLLQLWTIRGLHSEVDSWARVLLRADDPARRRTSTALLGARAAGPLADDGSPATRHEPPDPDEVGRVALFASVNGGIAGDLRTGALASRVARRLLAEDADELSHRTDVSLRALTSLVTLEEEHHRAAIDVLVADDDPSLRAMGLFLRGALAENSGDVERSIADAREAYTLFEQTGEVWGMGMAASGIGQWAGGRSSAEAEVWLERAEAHLTAVGALQDAESISIVRLVNRVLRGDPDARDALEAIVDSTRGDAQARARASLGLAGLAALEEHWDVAVERADVAVALCRADRDSVDQPRVIYQVAASVLRIRAGLDAEPLLHGCVEDALRTRDAPVIGAVAMGFGELAADRGDLHRARLLWAAGTRLGATGRLFFGDAFTSLLLTEFEADAQRTSLLAEVQDLTSSEVIAQLATLLRA